MYLFLFTFIIFIIIFYVYSYELFPNNNILILDKNELIDIIIKDKDNYYQRFNFFDLKVRNVKSINEYKEKILSSPINITNNEKEIIKKTINKIINIFENYSYDNFFIGEKANQIKWIIGIIDGKNYEEGLPHTRDNIIIIPKSLINKNNLIKVLIHEKIHIYQKHFKDNLKIYINKNFKKAIPSSQIINNRANPDIDTDLYYDKNNNLLYCKYNNNPTSIMDVNYFPINNPSSEHPYELIAYNIENDISSKYNL
jgi:hypothetical protein